MSFCKNLRDVISGINKQQPTFSILINDFNAKSLKLCPSDKDNKAEQYIDTIPLQQLWNNTVKQLVN